MKILLVRPPRIKQSVTLGELMFCEPIGLEIVYAVLKDRYDIRILDLMVEGSSLEAEYRSFEPDIVGITSLCIDVNAVKNIAEAVKAIKPEIVTVVGGTQAFFNPGAFFCDSIDHVMRFTTRNNLNLLFDTLAAGQEPPLIDGIHSRINGFKSTECFGRNEYITPDRSSTRKYRQHYSYLGYKPCAIMQTSLGCSKNCDFCLRWRLEGKTEQDIDLNIIIDQIKEIEEPSIMIYDNDFLNNRDRLEAFCDLLEKNGIRKNFICYASVKSITSHPDTIRRVARNGLRAVLVGYESFSQSEMEAYKKKSTVEDSYKASALLKELGIDCWASFILHPDWDKEDFRSFRRFIRRLEPEISTFSPLTPFSNLPLYEHYKGRLLFGIEDYEQWSFGKVSIRPSRMSLRRYYYEMVKTILYVNLFMNSTSYMVKRFGIATLLRLFKGSIKILPVYLKLVLKS
jgi:radical SAM superfamily enzyme YgiQ (UPF0313 family)